MSLCSAPTLPPRGVGSQPPSHTLLPNKTPGEHSQSLAPDSQVGRRLTRMRISFREPKTQAFKGCDDCFLKLRQETLQWVALILPNTLKIKIILRHKAKPPTAGRVFSLTNVNTRVHRI